MVGHVQGHCHEGARSRFGFEVAMRALDLRFDLALERERVGFRLIVGPVFVAIGFRVRFGLLEIAIRSFRRWFQ